MNIHDQNNQFDALAGLTDGQREYLISERRVASTTTLFTKAQAKAALGPLWSEDDRWEGVEENIFPNKEYRYSGTLITNSPMQKLPPWNEAEAVAERRGWNETVDGILQGVAPDGDIKGGGLSPETN